jgi:hypothetical protein
MRRKERKARAEDGKRKKSSNGEAARWRKAKRRRKHRGLKWRSAKVKNRRFPFPSDL